MKHSLKAIVLFLLAACCAFFICCACAPAAPAEQTVSIDAPAKPQATPAPLAAQAPVQTAEPTPIPTPTPTPIPEAGDDFYNRFFDDAVFIGDSITQGLQNYVVHMRKENPTLLGSARFVSAKSFNLSRACFKHAPEEGALRYKGKPMTIPEVIEATEATKVFIMLGVNDWAGSHIDECEALYLKLIQNIRESSPQVRIYVQSCTPVAKEGEKNKLNNENLDAFNRSLRAMCEREEMVEFVDVSSALKGEDNCLNPAYTSDHYVHMSKEGAAAWIGALYQYAYDSYAAGAWSVPE